MKITTAFDTFRESEILALGKSTSTNESYKYTEKKLIGYIGNIEIENLSVDDIHNFYLWVLQDCTKNTARSYVCQLRTVIAFCRNRGADTINPDDIKTPQREKKVARFITWEEYNQFIDTANRSIRGYSRVNRARNALIIKMLFHTGLRISELCALNRDSIHDRQFTVVGKSKNPRPCYITEEIEHDIEVYLAMRTDNSKALFVSQQTGKRITPQTVQSVFRQNSNKSGVFFVTPHTLRHSYATKLVEDGVDIRFVAALLGHQSLETTQKYTHIRDARLRQVYETAMSTNSW